MLLCTICANAFFIVYSLYELCVLFVCVCAICCFACMTCVCVCTDCVSVCTLCIVLCVFLRLVYDDF